MALLSYGIDSALSAPGGRRVNSRFGSSSSSGSLSSSSSASSVSSSAGSCVLTPTETQGPYPLYSSVVSNSALCRQDITEGKTGIPLALMLTLVNVNKSCTPLVGHDIYIWHCDQDGLYSGNSNSQNQGQAGLT